MKKMSEIMKDMALHIRKDPDSIPSIEAAHAALLLANVAWNTSIQPKAPMPEYSEMLKLFEKERPGLWEELQSSDPETLINSLRAFKKKHYPLDRRWILVCGMKPVGNIHVEFTDEPPLLESIRKPGIVKLQ